MRNLVRRLRDPAFGTETSERNLMNQAADRIEQLEAALRLAKDALADIGVDDVLIAIDAALAAPSGALPTENPDAEA